MQKSSKYFDSEQILRWIKDIDLILGFSEKFLKYPRSL